MTRSSATAEKPRDALC